MDTSVGGLTRSGAEYWEVAGAGAGNQGTEVEEKAERHKPLGGKEQTSENPLGM